jgi:hypothetical protein
LITRRTESKEVTMLRFLIPLLALATLPAISQPVLKTLDFSTEAVGDEPKSLLSMAGNWLIAQENGRKFLKVDGTNWHQGQSGANLADKARAIFGERHVEFLDSVKAQGYLDGKLYLESMLAAPVSGKVGLWSKADSVVLFDDFQITAGP